MVHVRTEDEIEMLRKSARVLIETFKEVEKYIRIGVKTETLDRVVEKTILDQGGSPAFKGYHNYPSSICASINDEVVHGIPGKKRLKDADILSIDIGVKLNGYFSDAAKTYAVGDISNEKQELMQITYDALHMGISKCKVGNRVSDISHAIQSYVESKGCNVVRALVGHGIGKQMHEDPQIPNYGRPDEGVKLKPGMVFAIEPMVNMGTHEVNVMDDGWTVKTKDHKPSAHFEHTVVITEGKPEILTLEIENKGEIIYG